VIKESIGVAYPAISETKLGVLKIAYPTSKKEQEALVENLNDKTKDIDLLITKAQKEIELIQEYRTRLISDVVAGKVDVRNVKIEDVADGKLDEENIDNEVSEEESDILEECDEVKE